MSLEAAILHCYHLKFDLEFEKALDSFHRLDVRLSTEVDKISYTALKAGFIRRIEGIAASYDLLEKVATESALLVHQNPFYHFEMGLNELSSEQYAMALTSFYQAKKNTKNEQFIFACDVNILLVKENLNLPCQETYEEVYALYKSGRYPKAFTDQMSRFQLRIHFESGDFKEIAHKKVQDLSQAFYLAEYALAFPYHSYQLESFKMLEKGLNLYNESYRKATIGHFLTQERDEDVKKDDLVDRAYLWLWRWMTGEDQTFLEKFVRSFPGKEQIEGLSEESKVKFELTCLWTKLFSHEVRKKIDKDFSNNFDQAVSLDDSLFSFEKIIVCYFLAKKAGDQTLAMDLKKVGMKHKLFKNSDIYLSDLLMDGPVNPAMDYLKRRIDVVLEQEANDDGSQYQINSKEGWLKKEGEEKCLSQTLATTASFSIRRQVCEEAELGCLAFDLMTYDPYMHRPRLQNTLSRLNRYFDEDLRFSIKEGKVYVIGDTSKIAIFDISIIEKTVDKSPFWRKVFRAKTQQTQVLYQVSQTKNTVKTDFAYKRTDLESILNKSRSATSRLLAKWKKSSLLVIEGQAKNTTYKFLQIPQELQ